MYNIKSQMDIQETIVLAFQNLQFRALFIY